MKSIEWACYGLYDYKVFETGTEVFSVNIEDAYRGVTQ